MQVYLEVVDGPLSGRRMVIRPPSTLTVGRTENADFSIPDDQLMSTVHLQLECDQHSCRVHDLNSTNGTLVNGQPINQQSLTNGDRIAAGQTTFRIHIEGAIPFAKPPVDKKPPSETTETKVVIPPAGVASASAGNEVTRGVEKNQPDGAVVAKAPDDKPPPPPAPQLPNSMQTDLEPESPPGSADTKIGQRRIVGAILEVKSGKFAGRRIWVRENQSIKIGRAETADEAIDDDRKLSSIHFAIEYGPTGWQIRDLNSSNGTFVNGQRVTQYALVGGERILAGETTFVVHPGLAGGTVMESPADVFHAAMADDDPSVRREALQAAVWSRQSWLLKQCRQKASRPEVDHFDELQMLAILGNESDVKAMQKIARNIELGPQRFEILGSYGHPEIMNDILKALDDPDPSVAVAAGQAFTRITGMDIESDNQAESFPEDSDQSNDLEQNVAGDAILPDSQLARSHWESVKNRYSQGTRWGGGHNLSRGVSDEIISTLDMLTRWESRLRGKYDGSWQGNLANLERFPG